MPDSLPLVKGTLDVLVLRALNWSPMHGVEILSWIDERAGGRLELEESALYQALYRLEERGFISAEWGVTENNRRARYYSIRAPGRAHLKAETARWLDYANTLTAVLTSAARPT